MSQELSPPEQTRPPAIIGRNGLLAGATLALLALIGFFPLTQHPTDLLVGIQRGGQNDLTHAFLAFRDAPRLVMSQHGEVPLWNPYNLAGLPIFSNPQSALLYPPNWIFFFCEATTVISWLLVAHHWWAGLGTYFFCRRLQRSWEASVCAGTLFMLAPFYVAQLGEGHYNQVCVAAWIPWGFWAYERFRSNPQRHVFGLIAVFVIAFFAGHVQELYYLVLTLSAFMAWDAWQARRTTSPGLSRSLLLGWGFIGLVTLECVAIELIPTWIYSRQTVRGGGMGAEDAGRGLTLNSLLELLDPMALGGPNNLDKLFYWESVCHFGVVPLLLAVVATVIGWRTAGVARLAIFSLLALNFAFGYPNPFFVAMHKLVPGVSHFRAPGRILFLASFAIAVLAAVGSDWLAQKVSTTRTHRSTKVVTTLLAFALLGATIFAFSGSQSVLLNMPSTMWLSLCIVAVTCAVATWWKQVSTSIVIGGLLLASMLELTMHSSQILATVPTSQPRQDSGLFAFLREHAQGSRVMARQRDISDHDAWANGLRKPQSYEPVLPRSMVGAASALERGPLEKAVQLALGFEDFSLVELRAPVAEMMGIRYVVLPPQKLPPKSPWREVWRGELTDAFTVRGEAPKSSTVCVYENPNALPRAFVVGGCREVPDRQDVADELKKIDPRKEIILDKDHLPPGERAAFAPAKFEHDSANRIVITTELDQPGYLFLSDMWYPGWTATDNGKLVRILPANLAFRAIPLEAGSHRIEMTFTPPAMNAGAVMTALALLCLIFKWRKVASQTDSP